MLWHGGPNVCGLWLPEDKKANMWHGRENVVAYGRTPFPTPTGLSDNILVYFVTFPKEHTVFNFTKICLVLINVLIMCLIYFFVLPFLMVY